MTPPDCWVPVPLRWRHVQPGDVVAAPDHRLGQVVSAYDVKYGREVQVVGWDRPFTRDPDATATVLVPASERDALTLTRDRLGAQVECRRLNQAQGAA